MKQVRCAIYTRKSSDEGLEQDFNSLDAQREACAAYVLSQASEGWKLVPEHYDDGGISGGTLERPALQRLLGDVKADRIDIIVVYKVDRLTRSLLDFSKLVEAFDEAGTSFVSVTQSFNTTTSMGRLTLNMLLSFAQFEREVTAERIRDKIAASKAKGMWMGGTPPLGYRPDGRSLAIVDEHAAMVRDIFARYRAVGNVRTVAEELAREGIRTPRRSRGNGSSFGGCLFTRGQLYAILRNPVYVGDIRHKDRIYPGNHPPIIEREEWDATRRQLDSHIQGQRTVRQERASLLAGLLFDPEGEPLIPVHTTKGRQRYRYYVRRCDQHGPAAPKATSNSSPSSPSLRLPAREIEQVVLQEIAALLADPLELASRCGIGIDPAMLASMAERAAALQASLASAGRSTLLALLKAITIHPDRIQFRLDPAGLADLLGLEAPSPSRSPLEHAVPVRLTRTGRAVRLIHDGGAPAVTQAADPALLRLILTARRWWAELAQGELDITALSQREGVTDSWMTRVVRLAFLSPQVVEAVLGGNLRAGVDGKALIATDAIHPKWDKQAERWLGRGR